VYEGRGKRDPKTVLVGKRAREIGVVWEGLSMGGIE
jgi:hypothetical protein